MDFDGVDDYLEIDGFAGKKNGWTIEFWAKRGRSSTTEMESILEFGKPGENDKIQIGFTKGNEFFIRTYFGYYKRFLIAKSSNKITDTNWHHWAIIAKPSSDNMLLYMDGKQVGEFPSGGGQHGGDRPLPGGKFHVNSRYGFPFKGQIDELRIWKVDLKPNELINRMAIQLKDKPGDLMAYYKFNDGKGENKAKNEVGKVLAVLRNMEEDVDWVKGKTKTVKKENKIPAGVNTALYFNGEADYLSGAGKVDLAKNPLP